MGLSGSEQDQFPTQQGQQNKTKHSKTASCITTTMLTQFCGTITQQNAFKEREPSYEWQ